MQRYLKEIENLAKDIKRQVKLMEVCGTHTQVIAESGLRQYLPKNIKLVSGPGCPVCVTDQFDIDAIVDLALAGIPIACYGDVIRVPGTVMSLAEAAQKGARIVSIYSIEDIFSLDFKKEVVFFGIGFETTAPMSASVVKRGIKIYSSHKSFVPAMQALLSSGELQIDGLISPGHVAAITGWKAFDALKLADGKKIPQVVSGFELKDVLISIVMLLAQIKNKEAKTENEYQRVVCEKGNLKALNLLQEVFCLKNSVWRGLGSIKGTGFELKESFAQFDAKAIYQDIFKKTMISYQKNISKKKNKCLCGLVIKGSLDSENCPLFGKECSPQFPQGPCMVSVEGSCCIKYKNNFYSDLPIQQKYPFVS